MKRKKKELPQAVSNLKARCAGQAASTKGRKTTFKDRKKDAARKACRSSNHD